MLDWRGLELFFGVLHSKVVRCTVYHIPYIDAHIVSKIDSRSLPVERGQDQLYCQQGWSGHLVIRLSLSLFVLEVQWYPPTILLWGYKWPLITVKVKFFLSRIGLEIQRGNDLEVIGYKMLYNYKSNFHQFLIRWGKRHKEILHQILYNYLW